MSTIYIDDKRTILRECRTELEVIIEVDGIECGASFLKMLLNSFRDSKHILEDFSKFRAVKQLLKKLPSGEAEEIRKLLRGE